ncbi:MAG: universal stress protein, partial [Corynebacterium flavescens]|nr:universal stress protein [Corynebacterium flavescens]
MAKKNTDTAPAFLLQKDPGAPIRILVSWSPHSTGNEAIEFAAWLGRTMPIQVRVVSTLFQPWGSTSFSK